jgi:hypothetical protein
MPCCFVVSSFLLPPSVFPPSVYVSGTFRLHFCNPCFVGQYSVVSTATCYRLDCQGSNPGGGEIFRACPDGVWGPPSHLYNGYRVCFPEVKRAGHDVDHQPPSSADVKERVELYRSSPSRLHDLCRVTFTFTAVLLRGTRGREPATSRFVLWSAMDDGRHYVYTCVSIWLRGTSQNDARNRDYLLRE